MGYSIQYGSGKSHIKARTDSRKKGHGYWIAILAAVIIPSMILVLHGHQMTVGNSERRHLPGQSQAVREAFNNFSDSVRSGEKFGEALECLYRQILEYEDSR